MGLQPCLGTEEASVQLNELEEGNKAQHSKVLDALLLDVGLLDLVWEPSRSASRLVNHRDAAVEDVDTLGATLS